MEMSGKSLVEANRLFRKSTGGLSGGRVQLVAAEKDRSFERWLRKWLNVQMAQIVLAGRRFILSLTALEG
jgi:hypothetical protein